MLTYNKAQCLTVLIQKKCLLIEARIHSVLRL